MKVNHDASRLTGAFGITTKLVTEYLRTIEEPQQLINDFYDGRIEAMVAVGWALKDAYGFQSLSEKSMVTLYGLAEIYRTPSRVVCVLQDDPEYSDLVTEAVNNAIGNM